jgi:hypothetical protein
MAVIIFLVGIVLLFLAFVKTPLTIKSHWQHFYDNCNIAAGDFYTQVEAGLKDRQIKGISVTTESFLQSHVFSAKRVYLRITENEYVFYICAAPFGTGTFISWWLCVKDEKIANKIPILSRLAGKDRNNKTFYQMDTEAMYKSAIHSVVASVADSLTSEKGYRLTELDRQYKELAR